MRPLQATSLLPHSRPLLNDVDKKIKREIPWAYSDELFLEQLDQVDNQFQDLRDTLKKVCKNLKEPGSPPPSEIPKKINSAIESFEELKSFVTEWAKSVQMPDTEAQELDSIKAITTFSKDITAHQGRRTRRKGVARY